MLRQYLHELRWKTRAMWRQWRERYLARTILVPPGTYHHYPFQSGTYWRPNRYAPQQPGTVVLHDAHIEGQNHLIVCGFRFEGGLTLYQCDSCTVDTCVTIGAGEIDWQIPIPVGTEYYTSPPRFLYVDEL